MGNEMGAGCDTIGTSSVGLRAGENERGTGEGGVEHETGLLDEDGVVATETGVENGVMRVNEVSGSSAEHRSNRLCKAMQHLEEL